MLPFLPGDEHHGLFAGRRPLEKSQNIDNHEGPKTTNLYDRTSDQITLDHSVSGKSPLPIAWYPNTSSVAANPI